MFSTCFLLNRKYRKLGNYFLGIMGVEVQFRKSTFFALQARKPKGIGDFLMKKHASLETIIVLFACSLVALAEVITGILIGFNEAQK